MESDHKENKMTEKSMRDLQRGWEEAPQREKELFAKAMHIIAFSRGLSPRELAELYIGVLDHLDSAQDNVRHYYRSQGPDSTSCHYHLGTVYAFCLVKMMLERHLERREEVDDRHQADSANQGSSA